MGDFDIDFLKLNRNKMYFNYFTMMNFFGYRPKIFRPARVSASSFTIIDQTWTNDYEIVEASGILRYCPSDHFPLIVSVNSGRRALNQNFIVCKVRRKNVNSHRHY